MPPFFISSFSRAFRLFCGGSLPRMSAILGRGMRDEEPAVKARAGEHMGAHIAECGYRKGNRTGLLTMAAILKIEALLKCRIPEPAQIELECVNIPSSL